MKQSLLTLLFVLTLLVPMSVTGQDRGRQTTVPDGGYALTAAYPNPATATTTFELTVERRQNVTVEVYNLLGQRVLSIFQGPMAAGETRQFTFDGGSVPSGVYLYSVRGERFSDTRQVRIIH